MSQGSIGPTTELGLSEERFHLLVDSVVDYAIFMLDPSGRIVSWNKGAQRIKGYMEREVLGRHFSIFYSEEDVAKGHPEKNLRNAERDGRFEEEGWRFRKDGSRFWASVVITPVYDPEGSLNGFAKVTRDVTQRREMEEQLRELNRHLESFAYSVSHDLRAPLRNMIFTANVLALDYKDQIDAEGHEMLASIAENAGRLARLITDLLALSRLSRVKVRRRHTDLSKMATNIWNEISVKERSHCDRQLEVQPSILVSADPALLRVALLNLLDNAIKFSPSGGCITVGEQEVDGRRAFFVRDQGIGLDPAYSAKIFLPFERLVPEMDGSGIGLANVKEAIARHGGQVWVESKPGDGATFYFTLG